MPYLPYVDGLRAVAILAVVVFHAFPAMLPGGFSGVDIFFVISGFLITRMIGSEIAIGTFSLSSFYIRRARRLLPASIACFAVVSIAAGFILLPGAFIAYGRSLISSVLMYANIYFYRNGGYFSAPSIEKPLLHVWSLAVEDQFYLTWPFILLLLQPRLPKLVLIFAVTALTVVALLFAQHIVEVNSEFAFYMFPTRAWELLLGCLLALIDPSRLRFGQWIAGVLASAGAASIIASFALLTPESNFPGLGAAPACLGTASIILASLASPNWASALLSTRPFIFIGKISYSLYLWHWPLIALTSYQLGRAPSPPEAAAIVSASLLLAYMSWRYVEQPFRTRHGSEEAPGKFVNSKFVVGCVVGVATLATLGGAISSVKGAPWRFSPAVRTILAQMASWNTLRASCDYYYNVFANDDYCNFGRKKSPGESFDVAVFGDSMGDHLVPLVTLYAQEQQLSARQVTNGGCGFFVGADIPATPESKARECNTYQREALKFIDANPHLKLAVISGFWEKWLTSFEDGAAGTGLSGEERAKKILAETIGTFTRHGIKVLLIGQVPINKNSPERCVVNAITSGIDPNTCGLPSAEAFEQSKVSSALLNEAVSENVRLFEPVKALCAKAKCDIVVDGTMLYKNEGHLNRYGSQYLRRFVNFPDFRAAAPKTN